MRRGSPQVLLVAVWLVCPAWAGRATAAEHPRVTQARAEMSALRFARALDLLDEALKSGKNGPAELAELHRLAGYAAGAIDREAEAVERFRQALSLEPDAVLEEGTSPKIAGPFERAKAAIRDEGPLKVRTEAAPGRRAVAVAVENDPEALVAGARITVPSGVLEAKGNGRIIVPVEGPGRVRASVEVIDRFGNVLLPARAVEVPEIPAVAGPSPQGPDLGPGEGDRGSASPPIYARWYVWGAASVVSLGLGVVFGLQARAGERDLKELNERSLSEDHDVSEAIRIVDRAERDALIANIAFGVGGALGVVAGVLLVREAFHGDGLEAGASLGPDGGSVRVQLRF